MPSFVKCYLFSLLSAFGLFERRTVNELMMTHTTLSLRRSNLPLPLLDLYFSLDQLSEVHVTLPITLRHVDRNLVLLTIQENATESLLLLCHIPVRLYMFACFFCLLIQKIIE